MAAEIAIPGDRMGELKDYEAGPGTYTLNGIIFASVVGVKKMTKAKNENNKKSKQRVEIFRKQSASELPERGDIITAKVAKVNSRLAKVNILFSGERLLKETFPGTIRPRDVRAFDIDNVQLYQSFRPGDVVRAEVISRGDQKSYYLSTARDELGVILGMSAAGHAMVPISWNQMQCPVTKAKEPRKVAKIKSVTSNGAKKQKH
ncbi:hypothetical protein AAMO2058_000427500 [Amorphochlora amoebiformis]